MCGIAGWVDFGRDLTDERDITDAMTQTMACRGPDDTGLWLARHVALGHRRLAVIDIEGGRQPMQADDTAVLTYSGEVYNYRELREELEGKGHGFRSASDTEVILRAYLEWGDDFVDKLNGMYAFALWDSRNEQLLLVRDRMGIKPLYYYPLPDGVLFGSEPKAILAHPAAEPVIDLDGLRDQLSFAKTPELTLIKGMYELRPGALLRVRKEGIAKRRYWQLTAHEHTDNLETTVSTVRELLDDIVGRQLISDVPLCTLLSGGLDSSAITALAKQHGEIRSFAVDFTGYAENFQSDGFRADADAPFVRELVRHVRPAHTDIVLDTDELTDPRLRETVVRAFDVPQFIGDMNTSLYMLFRAIRRHSTVALSGEAADEVFGGYNWFHLPRAVQADTYPWRALIMAQETPADLLHPDLLAELRLEEYLADSYRTALAEVPYLDGQTGHERRMREICYLHLTRFLTILLDRKDRTSMAVGLEVRVPFCDHRLVDYVFNTPWAMKTFDGREKSLLRAAVADVLPASILERTKAPYPATQDTAYEQGLREQVGRMVEGGTAPVLPMLNVPAVGDLLATPQAKVTTSMSRFPLELALDLDTWLTQTGAHF